MRSIRLSLIVYFLVLLGFGLGAVSLLAYQTTHGWLQEKQTQAQTQFRDRYEAQCKAEKSKLDEHLLRRARGLAELAQYPVRRNRLQALYPLGLLTASLNPQGHVLMPVWLGEAVEGPLAYRLHLPHTNFLRISMEHQLYPLSWLASAQCPASLLLLPGWTPDGMANPWMRATGHPPFQFADEVVPGNAEGQDNEYCEISGGAGDSWQRSRSLGSYSFPLSPAVARKILGNKWQFDEVELPTGMRVRRIIYRAPMPRFLAFFYFPRPQGPRAPTQGTRSSPALAGGRGRGAAAPWGFGSRGLPPFFFIQCASDTSQRDANVAGFEKELGDNLTSLEAESHATLVDLWKRLLGIALITFALTVAGGYWLVRLGLSPLHRLSEAVSRVSPRDFRLPLEDRRLPAELSPIVERLEHTLEQLKRAFAREKQAAADISHELRTPVAALLTTVEVALRRPRSPQEYREVLEDCRSSGQHMSQLVERLLTLARLDAGVDTLRAQEVDVAELAEECADLVRPLASARGLSLKVHRNGPACMRADRDKLREVLTNLLHNAIEYNRPEGAVDLTVGRDNGHLRFEVRDTGIGISPEAREHIFERFFRADPARQADGLHAGLGLAIVKGYVDLMGGTIAVESAAGQGSTFRVQLPA